MASVKITLDTRRSRKDQTYPVILRVTKNGRTTSVSLGVHVYEHDWDEQKRQVRKSHPNARLLNHRILEVYNQLEAKILQSDGADTVSAIARTARPEEPASPVATFFDYGFTWVERLNKAGRIGNARAYENTLKRLISYLGHNRLQFEEITFDFLEDFQANMLNKGVRLNTISFYLRTVRTIFNKAIKAKLVDRSSYPFEDFLIKHEATAKRAVGKEYIQMIASADLAPHTTSWHYRNYFLLSFHFIGMSFVDLAYLKWSDIQDGRIMYQRRKTGKIYNIKITPQAQHIMEEYRESNHGTPYILPIIPAAAYSNTVREMFYIRHGCKYCNIHLRKITLCCGIREKITTYVARHSWATIAKSLGYSKDLIAEALGHEYGSKVTGIYLDNYQDDVIDEVNVRVTS
jgi:integrase